MSEQSQQRAEVSEVHQEDGNALVNHHRGGGKSQAAVSCRKIPDAAHQWASRAAYQHQRLEVKGKIKKMYFEMHSTQKKSERKDEQTDLSGVLSPVLREDKGWNGIYEIETPDEDEAQDER